MRGSNPYHPPESQPYAAADIVRQRWLWVMTGFVVAAAAPVAFGMYGMHQFELYLASLGPDEGACGMGALGSLAMIFVVGPLCGMIGASAGWAVSGIHWRQARW